MPFEQYHDNKLTVLFLGRLVERKGCQLLLEAIAQLAKTKNLPEFRVVICGRGHLEAKLKAFVKANGLEKIVEFTGFVSEEDKPRYYASADVSVFPSIGGESFGIVLLEAMASGKAAVLAGDNPGYRSVMQPQPDLLFDPKSVAVLTEKLKKYLTDQNLRQQMSAWGDNYTTEFDTGVVGAKLLDIYSQALRKRRQS
jgi:phosphatidylinositol alpha-mannosyltransferase